MRGETRANREVREVLEGELLLKLPPSAREKVHELVLLAALKRIHDTGEDIPDLPLFLRSAFWLLVWHTGAPELEGDAPFVDMEKLSRLEPYGKQKLGPIPYGKLPVGYTERRVRNVLREDEWLVATARNILRQVRAHAPKVLVWALLRLRLVRRVA